MCRSKQVGQTDKASVFITTEGKAKQYDLLYFIILEFTKDLYVLFLFLLSFLMHDL